MAFLCKFDLFFNTFSEMTFIFLLQFNSKAGHPPVVLEMNEEEDQDNDRHNMSMDTDYNEDDDLPAFDEEPPNFDIHHIIIDCSAMMYTDAVGVKVLTQVSKKALIVSFRKKNNSL